MSRFRSVVARVCLVASVVVHGPAQAIDSLSLSLENLSGLGISAESVDVDFSWKSFDTAALSISIIAPDLSALDTLPPALRKLGKLVFSCPEAQLELRRVRCDKGQLTAPYPWLDRARIPLSFDYDLLAKTLVLGLPDLRLAGGRHRLDVNLSLKNPVPDWRVKLRLGNADLPRLTELLARFDAPPPPLELESGRLSGTVQAASARGAINKLSWKLQLDNVAGSDEEGTLAMEEARISLRGVARQGKSWKGNGSVSLDGGQYYADPVFIEIADAPLRLDVKAAHSAAGISVETFKLAQTGVLEVNGGVQVSADGNIGKADVRFSTADLSALYSRYLQAFLVEADMAELETEGRLSGRLSLRDNVLTAASVDLDGVSVDDSQGRFGLYGVNSQVRWDHQQSRISTLQWDAGHLFKLDLGAVDWGIESRGSRVAWQVPARLPILDGGLLIDQLVLGDKGDTSAVFEGVLTPISLQKLSHAFGWPVMEGKLSGVIPRVSLEEDRLAVDGVLLARAFDGQLTIRDLTIRDPLGVAPELTADVALRNLDLESLTHTFAFGKIRGRLEGWVRDLRMVAWQPVAFDAGLQTPEDDDSRHRISQRAVDNLTSLGGGVGGGLSRTFLRFFEEFSYDRLGLTCKLRGSVCKMGGVAEAERGYYIVKGGGLPRIDVIGYSSEVDWPTMLERLKRISAEGGPVIQ